MDSILRAAVFALALGVATAQAQEAHLRNARIRVDFSKDSTSVVEELSVDAGKPVEWMRIEHTLRDEGDVPLEVTLEGGSASVTETHAGPLRHVLVELRPGQPTERLTYRFAYRMSSASTRDFVPLAVPKTPTNGQGRPVTLLVEWPSDLELVGFPLPRASTASGIERRMGAVPALLRIPLGEGGGLAWLSRHAFDLAGLGIITASVVVGSRYRRRWES